MGNQLILERHLLLLTLLDANLAFLSFEDISVKTTRRGLRGQMMHFLYVL